MKRKLKRACLQRLHDTFGLQDYRPGQYEAVQALLSGHDVMCILPTGAGKSLCWQLPAVVHAGLTVVVSPLIALMRDQVQQLHACGIPAVSLDSLMTSGERQAAMAEVRSGEVRILFVSPERLTQESFRQICCDVPPWLLVVDEAHCVLQWGDSFRLAYGGIGSFIASLPQRPVLCAMTATADRSMQRGIAASVGMRRPERIWLPVVRDNLRYEVRTTLHAAAEILRLTEGTEEKTVIFCRTRSRAEGLAAYLARNGVRAGAYHAGMSREDRMASQTEFASGSIRVLCATSAFGMGVDVPGIRLVIHEDVPESITDYVQQTGRAGRDGLEASCIVFIEPNRLVRRCALLRRARSEMPGNAVRRLWRVWSKRRKQYRVLDVLMVQKCIPAGLAKGFGQRIRPCGRCSACMKGSLLRRVPDLGGMRQEQVRVFFLRWQRNALAERMGCSPESILNGTALSTAANKLVFPEGVNAPEPMERLLKHFRHESMHEDRTDWIS